MGEMLEKGGNPWRGMVYGMTSRIPWAGNPAPVWKAWDEFGMKGTKMIGYWSPNCPVHTDNPDVLATAYVKNRAALVSLGSWAPRDTSCTLSIDWKALGQNPAHAVLHAPAIAGFQPERTFRKDEKIPVRAGKGWLITIQQF
jgi:hypothetical protein